MHNNQVYYAFFAYYRRIINTKIDDSRLSYFNTIEHVFKIILYSFGISLSRIRSLAEPATFGDKKDQKIADTFSRFF